MPDQLVLDGRVFVAMKGGTNSLHGSDFVRLEEMSLSILNHRAYDDVAPILFLPKQCASFY
jgi:hypothetical protein